MIERSFSRSEFSYEIVETGYAGHAAEIARKCVSDSVDLVVAVGGDGTVNEVARSIAGSSCALGIIPCGSGDGLARHIGIPRDPFRMTRWLDTADVVNADYGTINGYPFFVTCGIGFDALVSKDFSKGNGRGKLKYVEQVLRDIANYKSETYRMFIDGEAVDMEAFLITCANANQWGNNAYISPEASLCDGLLDVSAISRFSPVEIPLLAVQLRNKQLEHNPRFFHRTCRELVIERDGDTVAHYDGEPVTLHGDIRISVVHSGLKIAVPSSLRVSGTAAGI